MFFKQDKITPPKKGKNDRFDYIKKWILPAHQITQKKKKKQWDKVFRICITDNELVFRTYLKTSE